MHAWATISHYLDYKSPQAIPSELRKDFHALCGLFYVADSHFELFFRSSQEARKQAERRIEKGSDLSTEEINLETVTAFIRMRYPRRKHADAESVSELVEEIVASGYTTLGEVDSDLVKASKAFEYYEAHFPPVTEIKRYNEVGVVRVSLSIVNNGFIANRKVPVTEEMLKQFREAREKMR